MQWPFKAAQASVDKGGAASTAHKGAMQVLCIEVGPNGVRTQRLGAPPVLPSLKPVMVEASTQTEIFIAAAGDIELDAKHSGEQHAAQMSHHFTADYPPPSFGKQACSSCLVFAHFLSTHLIVSVA